MIVSRKTSILVLLALLLVFTGVVLSLLRQKCLFVDDSQHIPSGYAYVRTADFRLNQEHPPLIKLLSGLGLLAVKPVLPLDSPGWQKAAEPGDSEEGTEEFVAAFWDANAERFQSIAFWGRVPMLIVPLALAGAVWWFARTLFGEAAGVVAALMLLGEPNVTGNATLVQDDLAAALALLGFMISLRYYLKGPSVRRGALVGAICGLAMLAKHSLVIVAPATVLVMAVHAVWRAVRKRPATARPELPVIVATLCAYLVLIAGYSFHVDWIDEDEAAMIADWLHLSGGISESAQAVLLHLPVLLPKYFVYGLDNVIHSLRDGRPAFLLGKVSGTGWWYYFPLAFVFKTTIPFLIASAGGLVWNVVRIVRRKWLDGLFLVLPPMLYLGLSMSSRLDIGVRHILPVFPFFAVAGAGALTALGNRIEPGKIRATAVAAFAVLAVVLPATIYPNYLTYFSPLAGGSAGGWKRLSDSNVETGQETRALVEFLKSRGQTAVEGIFIGDGFLRFYGISHCRFPCQRPAEQASSPVRYAAVGPWYLQEVDVTPEERAAIEPFRERQPEAMIGNSIFVYRIER